MTMEEFNKRAWKLWHAMFAYEFGNPLDDEIQARKPAPVGKESQAWTPEPIEQEPEPASEPGIPKAIARRMETWDPEAWDSMQQCVREGVRKPSDLGFADRRRRTKF